MNTPTNNQTLTQTDESAEQKKAFELYLGLGKDRSLKKVAEAVGCHRVTVEKWSSRFRWLERVKKFDEAGEVETQVALDYRRRIKLISLVDKLIEQFEQKVANNEIKLETPNDLAKIVNLASVLSPHPLLPADSSNSLTSTKINLLEGKSRDEIMITVQTTLEAIQRVMGGKKVKTIDIDKQG